METFFLACFVFGALFTVASVALGFAGSVAHGHIGGDGPAGDIGGSGSHVGDVSAHGGDVSAPPHIGHGGDAAGAHGGPAGHVHGDGDAFQPERGGYAVAGRPHLPLFNVSSGLAFLTWFGAAGYLLTQFAGWPALPALAVGVVVGGLGSVLVALFLGTLLAGERVMDPRDYQLEGTIARVTVGIPANGVGEIVFTKVGRRRSEAARSLGGSPIPRETEVVIMDYARGIASVQPWETLMETTDPESLAPGNSSAASES